MEEKALKKYLDGKATAAEKQAIYSWLKENSSNQKTFSLLKAKYVAGTLKNVSSGTVASKYEAFNRKKSRKKKLTYISSVTAASLVLFVMLAGYYNYTNSTSSRSNTPAELADAFIHVNTENGLKKEITLPDGSVVLLNVDSELTYPKKFRDDIREITLVGEGFFDIAHNKEKPFIVNVNDMKVKVLGTSFNVKSYPNDEKVETTLVTGKVELIREKESPVILEPSQKAVLHKSDENLEIEKVETSEVTAWREGKLVFNKTSMEQVIRDLERKYNTNFTINSPDLHEYKYTGTFDNLTLDEVLKLLTISSPIEYTITEEKRIVLNMK
ncbi:FecR family protein [Spongiimicrobium salis]|uniref:FecR family protein n=1 Tax=Spongiimicrobium salis TaxID=1667022 RepID=UPI00374D15C1